MDLRYSFKYLKDGRSLASNDQHKLVKLAKSGFIDLGIWACLHLDTSTIC